MADVSEGCFEVRTRLETLRELGDGATSEVLERDWSRWLCGRHMQLNGWGRLGQRDSDCARPFRGLSTTKKG